MKMDFLRVSAALALTVSFAAASSAETTIKGIPFHMPIDQVKEVKTYLSAELKDPDSAKFGLLNAAAAPDGTIFICGWINAKNGFGGYAGMAPFWATYVAASHHAVIYQIGGSPVDIESSCQKFGTSIETSSTTNLPD